MYDNEYDLDQILTEARRLKSQKVSDTSRREELTARTQGADTGYARPYGRPGDEQTHPYTYTKDPITPQDTAQDLRTPYMRSPYSQSAERGYQRQPDIPPTPDIPTTAPQGFRISRESAVFGEYNASSTRHAPSAPHAPYTEPAPSTRQDYTYDGGYQQDDVRPRSYYDEPRRAPSARPNVDRSREAIINEEYAALRERYRDLDPPQDTFTQPKTQSRRYDTAEDDALWTSSRPDFVAAETPSYQDEYNAQPDYVEPTPEPEETPPAPEEPVRSGFVLRRPQRPVAPDPVMPEPEPAPTAVAAPIEVTRQFDTGKLNEEILPEETAEETDMQEPSAARVRWQAYRMMEQEGVRAEEPDDEEERREVENDLNSPEDLGRVRSLLRRNVILSWARLGVLTLTGGFSIYLVLSTIATILPVPEAFHFRQAPGMFALVLFLLSLVSFAVSLPSLATGLISLFRLKADGDSMAAVASISTMIYTLAFAIKPTLFANQNAQMYCVVAVAGLWFNAAGKLMVAMRAAHNLSVIGSGEQLYAVKMLEGEGLAEEMAPLLAEGHPRIAALQSADFLKGLLYHTGASVQEKGISRILSPICVGAAAVLAASSYILYRDILSCFTVFTAVVCVCSPFTALFGENLPLLRAARSLTAKGAMIAGGEAAETAADASAVVVEAAQLFGSGGITLHGIRTFKGGRIDVSILAAASIMEKIGGTMAEVFFQIIEGRTEILEDVEDIVYEEGMGISAWVSGQHVLIGNRELMRHHGIELPPREYEQKYRQDNRHILYLSAGGELSSMFVISYNATDEVYEKLKRLERSRITLIVRSTDPNITREMLTDLFELDYDMVQIMPPHLHGVYAQQTEHTETAEAQLATMGGPLSLVDTIASAVKVRSAGAVASVLQTLFVILGYALTTILTFFFGISLENPLLLLSYQVTAALITMVPLSLRKY